MVDAMTVLHLTEEADGEWGGLITPAASKPKAFEGSRWGLVAICIGAERSDPTRRGRLAGDPDESSEVKTYTRARQAR